MKRTWAQGSRRSTITFPRAPSHNLLHASTAPSAPVAAGDLGEDAEVAWVVPSDGVTRAAPPTHGSHTSVDGLGAGATTGVTSLPDIIEEVEGARGGAGGAPTAQLPPSSGGVDLAHRAGLTEQGGAAARDAHVEPLRASVARHAAGAHDGARPTGAVTPLARHDNVIAPHLVRRPTGWATGGWTPQMGGWVTPHGAIDGVSAAPDHPGAEGEAGAREGRLLLLTLHCLGVVYGDIGTSVLYSVQSVFGTGGVGDVEVTEDNVRGVLSLMVWALIIVVTFK